MKVRKTGMRNRKKKEDLQGPFLLPASAPAKSMQAKEMSRRAGSG